MIYSALGEALYKRAVSPDNETPEYELPSWAYLIFLLDFILFSPLLLWLCYTVQKVWPIFAIVEDEHPPAYEPVALDASAANDAGEAAMPGPVRAVSSSARGIQRLLRANGGFRANFRGFFCYLAQVSATAFLALIFLGSAGYMYTPIATLIASLAMVQLSTAWVHIIITPRSELHFWSRLPSFNRTFNATWKAVVLYWAATEVHRGLPSLVAYLLGLQNPALVHPRSLGSNAAWGFPLVLVVSLLSVVFVVIPAHVILIRVQASLLPADADTIISFDRSFQGQVEPVIASGKGYATMAQAWSTFSRAAWRRLVLLYVKIFAIGVAVTGLIVAVALPEGILIAANSKRIN